METTVTPRQHGIKFGFITSLLVIALALILYVTDLSFKPGINYFSYILILGGIFMGIKTYRDKELGGFITFGTAFKTGWWTVLIMALVSSAFTYVFVTLIAPEFIDKIMEMQSMAMYEQGMSDEEIEMAQSMSSMFMTPGAMVGWALIGNLFIGVILNLIASATLKKNSPEMA